MSHAHGRIHPWDTLQIYDAQFIRFCYLIRQVYNEDRLPNRKRGEENPVNLFWRIYSIHRTLFWEKSPLNQGMQMVNATVWFDGTWLSLSDCIYFIKAKETETCPEIEALLINLMRTGFFSHFTFMPVGDKKAVRFIIVVHTAIPHCRIHDDCIFERGYPQGL